MKARPCFRSTDRVLANKDSDNISVFEIDGRLGQLEPVKGSPFATGKSPVAVRFHPDGRYLYVVNRGSGDISTFRIDRLSGIFSAVSRKVVAGNQPASIRLDAQGRIAYVLSNNQKELRKYRVDPVSGMPDLMSVNEIDPVVADIK